jgi:hypothetical protein
MKTFYNVACFNLPLTAVSAADLASAELFFGYHLADAGGGDAETVGCFL